MSDLPMPRVRCWAGCAAAGLMGAHFALAALFALPVGAQTPAPTPGAAVRIPDSELGVIRGRVLDADSGEPLAGVTVRVDTTKVAFVQGQFSLAPGEASDGFAVTAEDGRYTLRRVPAGARVVTAVSPKGIFNEVRVRRQVGAGQTMEDCDLRMRNPATVSGRVFDEKGEPLAGVQIHVVAVEYHAGAARQYLRPGGVTDENGEYRMEYAPAGRNFRLMAYWVPPGFNAFSTSKAPADPKLRRAAYARVFYPDAPSLDGGTVLKLRSGEERAGVDFILRRETSRCIEGKFVVPAEVKSLRVMIDPAEPTYGATRRGGSFGTGWGGQLDGDFRFRICQLTAGMYRVRAYDQGGDGNRGQGISAYTTQLIAVADRDVTGLEIPLSAPYKLGVALEWEGKAPDSPPKDPIPVSLEALNRAYFMGEQRSARLPIPGEAEMSSVLPDDYTVTVRLPGQDPRSLAARPMSGDGEHALYVKDIRYGDESVLLTPLQVGMQPADAKLRVLVASDAGTVSVRAIDGKGKPVGDSYVHLLPMDVSEKQLLGDALLLGQTDEQGMFTFVRNVPPGVYRAVATHTALDYSPESIDELWAARPQAPEIRVPPNGSAEVRVKLDSQ